MRRINPRTRGEFGLPDKPYTTIENCRLEFRFCMKLFTRMNQSSNRMERRAIRKGLFNRHVLIALLGLLIVYFLPPLLTGSQLLFDSWAAPVWDLAVRTGRVVGCGSLSCVPLILSLFLMYTYVLAVAIATVFREASKAVAG